MMTANIEKASQHAVLSTDYNHRLTANLRSDVLARSGDLFSASYHLPGAAKDGLALDFAYSRIGIPGTRNR